MNYVLMLKFCDNANQTLRIQTYHSREKANMAATALARRFSQDYPNCAVCTYVVAEEAEE